MEGLAAYSHLLSRVERSLVLDIGCRYTKCGFAGKHSPSVIIPTRFITSSGKELFIQSSYKGTETEWKQAIEIFLRAIFITRLGIGKGYKLIILDSLLYPTIFRNSLIYVAMKRFKLSPVKFFIAESMSLFAITPKDIKNPKLYDTGIILDVGYSATRALPIYEGVALTGKFIHGGVSSYDVLQRLSSLLKEHGIVKNESRTIDASTYPLFDDYNVLEDILVRCCFVCLRAFSPGTPPDLKYPPKNYSCFGIEEGNQLKNIPLIDQSKSSRRNNSSSLVKDECQRVSTILFPLSDGNKLEINGYVRAHAADILFEHTENYPSVASIILDSLLSSELDMRAELSQSIILSGGICNLSGFITRLMEELEELLQIQKYSSISSLSGKLSFYSSSHSAIEISWAGASLLGSLQDCGTNITSEEYEEKGNRILPKWDSQVYM